MHRHRGPARRAASGRERTAPPPAEGDVNLSPGAQAWRRDISTPPPARPLAEDERYFLRQSLSTPCLDVVDRAEGATLTDIDGRRILDFHGNSVHQVGYGHPRVVAAIKAQLDVLPFCPRRYTNAPAIDLARRLASSRRAGSTRCSSRRAARRRSAWR